MQNVETQTYLYAPNTGCKEETLRSVPIAQNKGCKEETLMSMKTNHQLPSPEVLKAQYPLSESLKAAKQQRDQEIRRIFTGESDKFVVLVELLFRG